MIFEGGTTINKKFMRPRWVTIGVFAFLCLSIIVPSLSNAKWDQPSSLNPSLRTILYVGGQGPDNYTKIQDAVDNASPDDTIFVYQGTYYEHVVLNKKVVLLGELRDETIIDGSNTSNVIKITANGTTVQQFTLRYAGIGIYIVHSSNQTIIQNSITHNWEGIGLTGSAHNVISGNIITHNGFEGINPVQTTFTLIQDNTIIDHLYGIYLSESTGNTIVGNTFQGNSRGVDIEQSSNNNKMFHNNFFSSEDANGYDTCSNTWDDGYPSGGNYWDDYHGGDANHDGIGDTPYNIPGGSGNKDHYPLMVPWNHPPHQPSDPLPHDGAVNVPINAELSALVFDPEGDPMNVSFYNAADNQLIGVDVNVASATRASTTWDGLHNMTEYHWYAIADDGTHTNQSDTWGFTTGSGGNQAPEAPTIRGPSSGSAGKSYNYTVVATDPDGNTVSYYIDWGDGTNSGWLGPHQSAEEIIVSHTWNKRGSYTIRAKAKDVYGVESTWGTLKITMPADLPKTFSFLQLFERFLDRHPRLFPILQYILDF